LTLTGKFSAIAIVYGATCMGATFTFNEWVPRSALLHHGYLPW